MRIPGLERLVPGLLRGPPIRYRYLALTPPHVAAFTAIGGHPTPTAPIRPQSTPCGWFPGRHGEFPAKLKFPCSASQKRGFNEKFPSLLAWPTRHSTQSPPTLPNTSEQLSVAELPSAQTAAGPLVLKAMTVFVTLALEALAR